MGQGKGLTSGGGLAPGLGQERVHLARRDDEAQQLPAQHVLPPPHRGAHQTERLQTAQHST